MSDTGAAHRPNKAEEDIETPDSPVLPISAPKPESQAVTPPRKFTHDNLRSYFDEEVDLDLASIPLSCFCFMTGYVSFQRFLVRAHHHHPLTMFPYR